MALMLQHDDKFTRYSVVTRLRCGGISNDSPKFTVESAPAGEIIFEIDQHLAK